MTFIFDPATRLVFDPKRGFELVSGFGGPEGRVGWKLVTRNGQCAFDSYLSFRDANASERAKRPEIERTGVWQLANATPPLAGMTLRETYEVLREALVAWELGRAQDDVNWEIRVPGPAGG
ncbi:MAG TPA: hypothetical protein VI168_13885 [Croceibacterium sp.]